MVGELRLLTCPGRARFQCYEAEKLFRAVLDLKPRRQSMEPRDANLPTELTAKSPSSRVVLFFSSL